MPNQRCTVNIHTGRKLSGKSRDEIVDAVLDRFSDYNVYAVQQSFELIRVSFENEEAAVSALKEKGVRIFDMWCRMDGGPPTTIVHLFDYPFEEEDESVRDFFGTYGTVRAVRYQKYIKHPSVCTGTRLVDLVMTEMPPRQVIINGYMCRVWFKGQPLVCNLCGGKGHRAAQCPNKDKCRLCGSRGHFARNCTNPWNNQGPRADVPSEGDMVVDQAADAANVVAPSAGTSSQHPEAEGAGSGNAVDSAVLDDSDPVGAGSNGASVESMPAAPSTSVADGVLNELFASSSEDDDDNDDDDDGSHVDITEFPSEVSEPPSQIISQFTDESQSILRNVTSNPIDSSTLAKNNVNNTVGNSSNELPVSSKKNVVPGSKSAPGPKIGPPVIPVVTIVDGDDGDDGGGVSVPDDSLMDVSGGSRKRKTSPGDLDSSDDSDPVSSYTEGVFSNKRAAGDPSGSGDPPSLC